MHGYTADNAHRTTTIVVIGLIASFSAHFVRDAFHYAVPVTTFSVFGILFGIYDHWLWRFKIAGIPLSFVQDWNGEYEGVCRSSYGPKETEITVCIQQTWSKILIKVETESSASCSTFAAWFSPAEKGSGLRYEFSNEDKELSEEELMPHRGVASLVLSADGVTLTGRYYTEPSRRTEGVFTVTRKKS